MDFIWMLVKCLHILKLHANGYLKDSRYQVALLVRVVCRLGNRLNIDALQSPQAGGHTTPSKQDCCCQEGISSRLLVQKRLALPDDRVANMTRALHLQHWALLDLEQDLAGLVAVLAGSKELAELALEHNEFPFLVRIRGLLCSMVTASSRQCIRLMVSFLEHCIGSAREWTGQQGWTGTPVSLGLATAQLWTGKLLHLTCASYQPCQNLSRITMQN